jgi:hypothetical protein
MFKRLFIFGILICLANCTAPGSAFFGPTFTGVKTGSVYQTSLSYGSSKAVDTIKVKVIENIEKFNELELSKPKEVLKKTQKLVAIKTHKIIISDPIVEEPLP